MGSKYVRRRTVKRQCPKGLSVMRCLQRHHRSDRLVRMRERQVLEGRRWAISPN